MAVSQTQLEQLYLAYFGRPADFDGLVFYTSNPNFDIWSVAAAFSASPESQALYGTGFSAATINAIYQNLFNRDAEPAGLLYWSQEVASGRLSAAGAAYGILLGAQNEDLVTVNNKMAASAAFTAALDTAPEIIGYSGDDAAQAARDWLAGVTADPATLTAALAGVDAAVAAVVGVGGVDGETFTLTTGLDTVVGTTFDDTINAAPATGSLGLQTTLNNFDSIDGGAGNDTMNIYVGESSGFFDVANGTQQGTVKNVEVINIFNAPDDSFGNGDINAALFQGAQQIWQSGDDADVYNVAVGQTVGFRGLTTDMFVDVDAAATADSLAIALDNVTNDDGYEEFSIDADGDALGSVTVSGTLGQNTDGDDIGLDLSVSTGEDVTAGTVTSTVASDTDLYVDDFADEMTTLTLNMSGDTVARIWNLDGLETVDASASTGGIWLWGEDGTLSTIKTGSGDDDIDLRTVTAADVLATTADETITASASTGAGDDVIDIQTSGDGAAVVDAGAGDDEVSVIGRNTGKLTIGLGDGDDEFTSSQAINGTDVIDGGAGSDALLLNLIGSANIGAFRNFEVFDAVNLGKTLDVDILGTANTVTEIIASGDVGASAVLINLGAGVGFRATADVTSGITLTQKTAGALTVTLDVDEEEADTVGNTATMSVTASNATSVTAVFASDYADSLDDVTNTSTINLTAVKAASVTVNSGGTESLNVFNVTTGPTGAAGTASVLKTITVTGDQHLTINAPTLGTALNDLVINASASTGGLTASLADVKNTGSITLGSGADTITVTADSTATAMESIVGFEKAVADAFGATPDLAIADSDKLLIATGYVAADDTDGADGTTVTDGVVTFTGAGPATLAAAIALVDAELATLSGETAVFQYIGDTYVFVDGVGSVVKLTGVTGVTELAEVGVDLFILG